MVDRFLIKKEDLEGLSVQEQVWFVANRYNHLLHGIEQAQDDRYETFINLEYDVDLNDDPYDWEIKRHPSWEDEFLGQQEEEEEEDE